MLIRDKKEFTKGLLLMAVFVVVLILIFSDIYPSSTGQKANGLDYADDLFNSLSKGSSYFIGELQKNGDKFKSTMVDFTIKMKSPDAIAKSVDVFTKAGMTATAKDNQITVSGNLQALGSKVLAASDLMYKNNDKALADEYGMDGKEVLKAYWDVLAPAMLELQKKLHVPESNFVDQLNRKAIEPAYNYFGVVPENIMDKIGLASGLLVFYVIYTMWYGFAIIMLLEGMGLSMKKAKIKKEV